MRSDDPFVNKTTKRVVKIRIKNKKGECLLLMSQSANHALTDRQKDVWQEFYTKLIIVDLANIENIGGGSARCMVQELY